MKRILEVREKRQKRFYEARMKGRAAHENAQARKEIEQNITLVQAPDSLRKGKKAVEAAAEDKEATPARTRRQKIKVDKREAAAMEE